MPQEPEHQMDELLKALAKKRRDEAGAPFDLHPATRSMLQAEVARALPGKPEKPVKPGFFNFRNLIFAGAAVASIAICATLWMRENAAPPATLGASTHQPSAPVGDVTFSITPASAARPSSEPVRLAKNKDFEEKEKPGLDVATVSGKSDFKLALAKTETSKQAIALNESAPEADKRALSVTTAPVPETAAQPSALLGGARRNDLPSGGLSPSKADTTSKSATQPLLFANVSTGGKGGGGRSRSENDGKPPILTTFQVQLDGALVRLTDSDGSVYTGRVEPVAQATDSGSNSFSDTMKSPGAPSLGSGQTGASYRSSGVAAATSNSASGVIAGASNTFASTNLPTLQRSFSFTVTGTNSTLKQPIVIHGSYIVAQPQQLVEGKKMHQANHMDNIDAVQGAKIQGEARVGSTGTGKKISIDAVTLEVLKTRNAP